MLTTIENLNPTQDKNIKNSISTIMQDCQDFLEKDYRNRIKTNLTSPNNYRKKQDFTLADYSYISENILLEKFKQESMIKVS